MPKIIKNGVTYIGTSDNAAAVSYDNTTSGLNATDVQAAIDEVNSKGIDDIDNVTLTTSDNNKLLGVSVSGSDISVGAVELTAADIPYSQGVSVADKINSINTCETIYTQSTYQNDIGTARSIGDYDFRNYRVLRITLYANSISSSTRVAVVIVNANASIGASYYPCVLNGTNGNIRIESTNNNITILALSSGNSICIGEIKGVK
jgi:hypothetical protein